MKLLVNSKDFLVTQIKISEINRNKKTEYLIRLSLGVIGLFVVIRLAALELKIYPSVYQLPYSKLFNLLLLTSNE